jgi:PAS domain S-box-containing protein
VTTALGGTLHLRVSGIPLFDAAGTFTGYRGVSVDETKEVEKANALRESQEMLRAFMDATLDRVFIFDADLNLLDANAATIKQFGLPKEEVLGRNLANFAPAAVSAGRFDAFKEVLRTGEPFRFDSAITRILQGGEFHVSGSAFASAKTGSVSYFATSPSGRWPSRRWPAARRAFATLPSLPPTGFGR